MTKINYKSIIFYCFVLLCHAMHADDTAHVLHDALHFLADILQNKEFLHEIRKHRSSVMNVNSKFKPCN